MNNKLDPVRASSIVKVGKLGLISQSGTLELSGEISSMSAAAAATLR
jgi:hypothetical protein